MVGWFREEGLVADAPPIVGAQENAGNPHYAPTREQSRADSARTNCSSSICGASSISRARSTPTSRGRGLRATPPAEIAQRVRRRSWPGRDAAVDEGASRRSPPASPCTAGKSTGPTRDVITAAGFGDQFIHRTGHSLGEEVHGNGVHMDDYETHDDRRLVPGTGFTIEPGIYTPTFGVRTEINMVVGERSAEVTGPRQQTLVRIATRRLNAASTASRR